ncbi:MAG: glycosyltransferase [Clostridia bacterium]
MNGGGGIERVISILANNLVKDIGIHVVALNNVGEHFYYLLDGRVNRHLYRSAGINIFTDYFLKVFYLAKLFRKEKIRIVISCDIIQNIYCIPATFLSLNASLFSWDHFSCYETLGVKWMSKMRVFSSWFSKKYICLTLKDYRYYKNKDFFYSKNLYQLYNATPDFDITPTKYDERENLIITAGHLLPIKGYCYLVEVANIILKKHPDWKWVICGEGIERNNIENKIVEYKLEDKLILTGRISDIATYYNRSSIYVMTSLSEGFPMTLLEAQYFGLPLVSFDINSGPSEIIIEEKNGFLIPPFDINKMADVLDLLINKPNERKRLSNNSLTFSSNFTIGKIISLFKENILCN